MKEYPFISIVVVVYNAKNYIGKCIDSLLNLEYPKKKYEILIVDGNSNDGTQDIIKNYPVKFLLNKKRKIAPGRNLGVDNTKGDYIAFTDSDCEVDRNWLKTLVITMLKEKESTVAVGGPNLILEKDPVLAKVIGYMQETFLGSGGSPQSYLIKKPKYVISLPNCNILYRKEIVSKRKYDPRFNVGEDAEFNFRLSREGYRFLYLPNAIVWHHRRDSLKEFIKNMFEYGEAMARISKKHKKLVRKYSVLPSIMVLSLLMFFPLIIINQKSLWVYIFLAGFYFLFLFHSATYVVKKIGVRGISSFVLLPLQHIVYGLGFFKGLV